MDRIVLAKIAGAHGVKGLVKIHPFGEDISLLETISPIYTDKGHPVTITLKNASGKFILAAIEGIENREDAESLKGTELCVDADQLPEIEDTDSFYYHNLVGMDVADKSGAPLGTIKAVENYGAGDLLDIQFKTGERFLLPFTKDTVPDISDYQATIQNYEEYIL